MLECVVNVSVGEPGAALEAVTAAAGTAALDVHSDPHHNRSVLTLAGPGVEAAARAVAVAAVARLDLRNHAGAHPRIGVVDVVPFVPLHGSEMVDAVLARDRFARWLAESLAVPCFLYGPERSLPEVRRHAFVDLRPDTGPPVPHPSAGATAVGARPVLVAYNVWLAAPDLDAATRMARALRGPAVRALALRLGDQVQVSMNLVRPDEVGPAAVYDRVAAELPVARAELVGLVPRSVLEAVPEDRWAQLDLARDRTIESRLARLER